VRVREAAKLGFRQCVLPESSMVEAPKEGEKGKPTIKLLRVKSLSEALAIALD